MDINSLTITPEILNLIAEIDEFKGSWKALGTLAPERLAALRKVATIESIGSSTRIEADRQTENPDWNTWFLFFLRSLKRQKDRLAIKLERERIMQSDLSELSVKILELAKEHGRISTGDIVRYTQASRSTIKARINELIEMKKLMRHGKGRSTWYSLG